MQTSSEKRLDPRRKRTIDALLEVAQDVLAEQGVDEVTVEEIAARAGVSVGSIYNAFGSKAGLYAALVDRALDLDEGYMDRAYTAERTPYEQLLAASEQYLRFALEHPLFFRMLAFPQEAGAYPAGAETVERMARRVDAQNARMVDALERASAEGTLRRVDTQRTATLLWASWNGIISLAWRQDELRQDPEGLRDLLKRAAEIVTLGLQPR